MRYGWRKRRFRPARRPNFAVDCAEDGDTGLDLAENRCYDLIILDLMLPGWTAQGC